MMGGALLVCAGPVFAAPDVLATLKPVHSLVAGVMDGVGTPQLLLDGGSSPHLYMLKPSGARLLRRADLIFWIGEDLETFMPRALQARRGTGGSVKLSKSPGVRLRKIRGLDRSGGREHAGHGHDGYDMHIWLDPLNAKAMVTAIEGALGRTDPANARRYGANARRLLDRLDRLDLSLRRQLAPIAKRPYVVFHDGYRYFEDRYRLNGVGAITLRPDVKPGARRVREVRGLVARLGAACIFTEPQFEPALVRTILRGTDARAGVLDPLGADLDAGREAYFVLMRRLAGAFRGCLGPAS